jgi:hypothetical protein
VDDGILVRLRSFHRPYQLAVFQHGHPVGDGKNLVQLVADIYDSQSLFPQQLQAVECRSVSRSPMAEVGSSKIRSGVALNGV